MQIKSHLSKQSGCGCYKTDGVASSNCIRWCLLRPLLASCFAISTTAAGLIEVVAAGAASTAWHSMALQAQWQGAKSVPVAKPRGLVGEGLCSL